MPSEAAKMHLRQTGRSVHRPADIAIVNIDEWEGVYVNGELKREEHRLSHKMVFEAAGIALDHRFIENQDFVRTVEDNGGLPQKLSDVPRIGCS